MQSRGARFAPLSRGSAAVLFAGLAACAAPAAAPTAAQFRSEPGSTTGAPGARAEHSILHSQEPQEPQDDATQDPALESGVIEGADEFEGFHAPGIQGYPTEGRVIGGPTDVDVDLATSFPRPNSLWAGSLLPDSWSAVKERIYEDVGLKFAASYQTLVQTATSTNTGRDTAWAGWFLLEAKWELLDRKGENTGSLVADLDWRHTMGGQANPAEWGVLEVGSLWPTDVAFFDWDPSLAILYWEQWLPKDTFVLRLGKQLAINSFDFFRFKDARTSFSATPLSAHTSIPAPAFGQAVSFKWWPKEGSGFYVHGTLNDMNGDPTELGLDTFFDEREYFYGLELGYNWRRSPRDFDHVHVDFFYADEKSSQPAFLPNEAGGGFKVLGEKQKGRWVSFGSYTYNEAEGGGLGLTFAEHTLTAGVSLLNPFDVRGEASIGTVYMTPIDDNLRDQYGGEVYWKLLVAPDLWVTPGFQFIFDPSFRPDEDFVGIAQLKLRLFL